MRTTIRVQIVGSTLVILLAALGAYAALATSLVTQDKLAYVYQVTSFLAGTKAEEVHSSLSSTVDKLRFVMAFSGEGDDLDTHLHRVVDADEELMALELWKRGTSGDYALLSRLVREDRLRAFGLNAADLAATRQGDPIPFEALRRTGVALRNASLPPDLPILTVATALGDTVAVADLHPQHLLRLFAGLELGHAYLVDSRGSILLHSEPEIVIARRAASSELVTEAFSAKVKTGVREMTTPGGTVLGAYANLDYGDVAVVIETPKDTALQAAARLNRQAILLAIVVVLLAVMVGIISSRRIVAPLRRLEAITATIAQGDFSVDVPETGPNETRTMAASLNRMRHDLADREQRLTTMVGSLAGGVAHEANNPLASVIANIDFALASLRASSTDAEVTTALEDARAGGLRVRDIVRDLREFASSETSAPAHLDVQTALDAALKMAAPQLKYRGEVEKVYHPVPAVLAPERELAHAFLNLVVNAARALPEQTREKNRIRLATRTAEDGAAIVEVTDTGDGIPADEIGRVFDPYYAGHLRGVGSSLGLAITRTVVDRIGGTIRVTSEVGRGTTFTVTLPAAAEGTVAPTAPGPESQAGDARRILVIDDDPLVRTTLERLLGRDAEVISVRSGTAALRTLETDAGFDAVLCDIMMPDISGIDVYQETYKRDPELAHRFVFMTGGVYTERVQDFRTTVDNPVLEKPFDHETLVAAIARSTGGKRG